MFYAVIVPPNCELPDGDTTRLAPEELIFEDIKKASSALKTYKGSRMKTFESRDKAVEFVRFPERDESFIEDPSFCDLSESLERLSLKSTPTKGEPSAGDEYPSVKPAQLNLLRRKIEAGECEQVEKIIWSNPKSLVTVCDSAVYLMAGPKYNACHIAARANKPDIMALLLDTISNISFMKKLYPNEEDTNLQDRVNHLLDSYLNTPDPKQGNTPLHFACKLGHYRVVRVLLTFEDCDLNRRDCSGQTAEESICSKMVVLSNDDNDDDEEDNTHKDGDNNSKKKNEELELTKKKIKNMFKCQLHLPLHRDQLKKCLLLAKRRDKAGANFDSDVSFSDESFSISPIKKPA